MKRCKIFSVAFMILMLSGISHAAPFNQTFRNEYQTDSIYLFITEGDVEFSQLLRAPRNWEIGINTADMLSIFGPVINPGRRFRVRFSDDSSFTMEWAEVLNGDIVDSGSLIAVDGTFVGATPDFTSGSQIHAPTTGSLWLLGSGLICLFCARRKLKEA